MIWMLLGLSGLIGWWGMNRVINTPLVILAVELAAVLWLIAGPM